MSLSDNLITRWLTRRRKAEPSKFPLQLTQADIDALKVLQASPQWARYLTAIDRVAEQQATELASGLPHDRYLFISGALTALRRIYTLVDDLVATATQLQEISDARAHTAVSAEQRRASTYLNTPWYDGWRRSGANTDSGVARSG